MRVFAAIRSLVDPPGNDALIRVLRKHLVASYGTTRELSLLSIPAKRPKSVPNATQ